MKAQETQRPTAEMSNRSTRLRRIIGTAIAALTIAAAAVVVPATAANADPAGTLAVGTCATTTNFSAPGGKTVNIPTTSGGSRDCAMSVGNVSSAVTRLQQDLNNGCNLFPGAGLTVDGQFGSATASALANAQSQLGITADGEYGTQTASTFNWLTTDGTLCVHLGI